MKAWSRLFMFVTMLICSTHAGAVDDIETAFSCEPARRVFSERTHYDRAAQREIVFTPKTGQCFTFKSEACISKMNAAELERLSSVLEEKYMVREESQLISADYVLGGTTCMVRSRRTESGDSENIFDVDKLVYQDRALKAQLLQGSLPITKVKHAELYYSDASLALPRVNELAESPLLQPNKSFYVGSVLIELQEKNGTLRCRTDRVKPHYIFLRTKKAVSLGTPQLKIGGVITVLGKYVGNVDITMTTGEQRIAPVLEVTYIE